VIAEIALLTKINTWTARGILPPHRGEEISLGDLVREAWPRLDDRERMEVVSILLDDALKGDPQ